MARDSHHLASGLDTDDAGGMLSGFLADEEDFDRRSLWRLGSWGVGSVAAVILALLASQSSMGLRRDQVAAADLALQSQQLQSVAKDSKSEARRLASAIDTLNSDRDRLYSRVTVLEQGLDTVTGAISRQNATLATPTLSTPSAAIDPAAKDSTPVAPVVAPVATTTPAAADKVSTPAAVAETSPANTSSIAKDAPATTAATPLVASKSLLAPPDSGPAKLIEAEPRAKTVAAAPIPEVIAALPPAEDSEVDTTAALSPQVVQRTEFGIDVGGANSINGLRALWRRLRNKEALAALRPVIVVKETKNGLGMQLRLIAGPISDAAAAAKICAGLLASERACETAVFEGQRLAMKADEPAASPKPAPRRRGGAKHAANDDAPRKPDTSTLSSFFGRR